MIGYDRFGEGPQRVLALHGWFGDERTFLPLEPAIAPGVFTYVTPAYRGYGASRDIAGAHTIDEIAADALAIADALGWERFHVVGHSMGGKVAQYLAATRPDRVDRVVAIASVPANGQEFDPAGRALFEGAAAQLDNRRAIINFSTGNRLTPAWIDHVVRASTVAREEAFAAYFRAWADTDFHQLCAGSTVPLKVLVGRYDAAITEQLMRDTLLRWFSNAELDVIDNAGHYPMDEAPVATATALEAFLTA